MKQLQCDCHVHSFPDIAIEAPHHSPIEYPSVETCFISLPATDRSFSSSVWLLFSVSDVRSCSFFMVSIFYMLFFGRQLLLLGGGDPMVDVFRFRDNG